ncbi:hypothetical protein Acr_29g0007460 [Actinidia rufa]|uniref:DUF4283 domain-containing protein n=1 Tax=Actinidia rufa TaxID=165716 RepID=A0A7J0HG22_9ERIC|nr:hypothetical protein Acr_29g0007460 [Actinidia rufa]
MPRLFKFGNEAISCFPVWVQLRYVPLDMWNAKSFGKICSIIGKPIHMDKMTTQKERVTYARCLVEIDMTKEIKHTVKVNLNFSGEGIYEQPIFYENLPRFCTHCRTMGHTKEGCKVNKAAKPTEVVTEKGKETEAAAAEFNDQTGTSGAGTKNRKSVGMGDKENKGRERAKRNH